MLIKDILYKGINGYTGYRYSRECWPFLKQAKDSVLFVTLAKRCHSERSKESHQNRSISYQLMLHYNSGFLVVPPRNDSMHLNN